MKALTVVEKFLFIYFFAAIHATHSLSPSKSCSEVTRRCSLEKAFAFTASTFLTSRSSSTAATLENYSPSTAVTSPSSGREFFPTVVPPLTNRATYRYSLGRNAYALEQLLAFTNVTATIRTNVIQLSNGDLWVHSPQYPTGEFCKLLDELGPVRHIVLGCNALEHKAPMKAFVKKYPKATVWIAPGQYGPFGNCGTDLKSCNMGYPVDGIFPLPSVASTNLPVEWMDEFDFRTLYVALPENAGPVSEVVFLHKPSKSLITSDSVIYIPDQPPPIFGTFFSNEEMMQEGFWEKSVLQSVFLTLRQEGNRWPGYDAIKERLIRAPILRAFGDARAPDDIEKWVNSISSMGDFDRILTSHFASPIAASPAEFTGAFSYLKGASGGDRQIACQDWELLDGLNDLIDSNNLGAKVVFDFKAGCL